MCQVLGSELGAKPCLTQTSSLSSQGYILEGETDNQQANQQVNMMTELR